MSLLSRHRRRSDKTRFMVLCWARTGSYLLTDLLNQQPGVVCHEEIFKKGRVELRQQCLDAMGMGLNDTKRRDAAPVRFLEEMFSATAADVVGFKLFPGHKPALLERLIRDPKVRIVLLTRNPVQVQVSLVNARDTGKWTQRRDKAQERDEPLTLDVGDLLNQYFAKKVLFERLQALATLDEDFPLHVIDYSELHDPDARQRLARFLGLTGWSDDAQPTYFKQLRKPYEELVDNWDEVLAACAELGVNPEQDFASFTRAVNARLA